MCTGIFFSSATELLLPLSHSSFTRLSGQPLASASRTSAKLTGFSMRTHSCPIMRTGCLKYFFRTGSVSCM